MRLLKSSMLACALLLSALAQAAGIEPLPLENQSRSLNFTVEEGTWISVDTTPDGEQVVFDLLGDLYTMPMAGGAAVALTRGMAYDSQPRISPNGEWIAFVSDRDGDDNLWVMRRADGVLRRLSHVPQGVAISPSWTPDSQRVLVAETTSYPSAPDGAFRFYSLSGEATDVKDQESKPVTGSGGVVSRDGRYLYFAQRNPADEARYGIPIAQIRRLDLTRGTLETLTNGRGGGTRPVVSSDGKRLIYATREEGKTVLRARDLESGADRLVTRVAQQDRQDYGRGLRGDHLPGYALIERDGALLLSAGGKIQRVSLAHGTATAVPFRADVSLKIAPRLHKPYRVEQGSVVARIVQSPSFSPDGKQLVMSILTKLYVMPARAGAAPRRLTRDDALEYQPVWSPDGLWVAYVVRSSEGGHIWRVRRDGRDAQRLTVHPAFYTDLTFSPDGQRILAMRGNEHLRAGLPEGERIRFPLDLIWIPASGGEATVLAASSSSRYPHFGPEPDRIYTSDGHALYSIRDDGTDPRTHLRLEGRFDMRDNGQPTAEKIIVSPDGMQALALINKQVWRVTALPTAHPKVIVDAHASAPLTSDPKTRAGEHTSAPLTSDPKVRAGERTSAPPTGDLKARASEHTSALLTSDPKTRAGEHASALPTGDPKTRAGEHTSALLTGDRKARAGEHASALLTDDRKARVGEHTSALLTDDRKARAGEHASALSTGDRKTGVGEHTSGLPMGDRKTGAGANVSPLQRLTDVGADYFGWAGRGHAITWAIGSTIYRVPAERGDELAGVTAGAREASPAVDSIRVELRVPRAIPKGTIILRGANVIPMSEQRGATMIELADIVITGNRIAAIGPTGTVDVPAGASVIDVRGKFVVPGFIDTHAHWEFPSRDIQEPDNWSLRVNLAYGVTAGLDVQSNHAENFIYQDLVDTGQTLGTRAFMVGPGVFGINNYKMYETDFRSYEETLAYLRRYQEHYRTHNIKAYLTGNRRQRQWVVRASQELGLMPTTEGYGDPLLDITHALDGMHGTEHAMIDSAIYGDVVALFAGTQTSYTPTLNITHYGLPGAEYFFSRVELQDDAKLNRFYPRNRLLELTARRQVWARESEFNFRAMGEQAAKIQRGGGLVGVGSHGELQGLGYHWELQMLEWSGLRPAEILRAATLDGARIIGVEQDLGSLEAGKLADLLVLEANPLLSIRNAGSIAYVMQNGVLRDGRTLARRESH